MKSNTTIVRVTKRARALAKEEATKRDMSISKTFEMSVQTLRAVSPSANHRDLAEAVIRMQRWQRDNPGDQSRFDVAVLCDFASQFLNTDRVRSLNMDSIYCNSPDPEAMCVKCQCWKMDSLKKGNLS